MGDVEMNECALSNVEEMNQGAMVQRQIEKAEYETVSPHNKNDSVIEFKYVSEDCFIELNKTEIEVKLKIKKADGNDLENTDNVGLINYAAATLFKDAEIQVNGKTITEGSSNYAGPKAESRNEPHGGNMRRCVMVGRMRFKKPPRFPPMKRLVK